MGVSVGMKGVISKETRLTIVDFVVLNDQVNDTMSVTQVIDMVQELQQDLSRNKVSNCFKRKIWPQNTGVLKPKSVLSQGTTTKRYAITVSQKCRWFRTYKCALELLREKSIVECRKTGKTFG